MASRTLVSSRYTDTTGMTVENCVNFCKTRNFFYAGVENGQECCKWCLHVVHGPRFFSSLSFIMTDHTVWEQDCGNAISDGTIATESDCCVPCSGNVNENCGASNRLNMYQNSAASPPVPVIAQNYGPWASLGCYRLTTLPF